MITPNPFVYEKTFFADICCPSIPSLLQEHYSQCGEDLIIVSFINGLLSVGRKFDFANTICVEIGANHGFAGSNTYLLGQQFGIRSLLVEANPDLIDDLKKARPGDMIVNAAVVSDDVDYVEINISNHHELSSLDREFVESWHEGKVGLNKVSTVPAIRINKLFNKYFSCNSAVLYLSIDVEGKDLEVIMDLDLSIFRPMLVQMEPSEHFSPGETDKMISYMSSQGYILLAKTPVNLIFVDKFVLHGDAGISELVDNILANAREIQEECDFVKGCSSNLSAENTQLSAENTQLSAENTQLSAEKIQLLSEIENQSRLMTQIYSSRSWKFVRFLARVRNLA